MRPCLICLIMGKGASRSPLQHFPRLLFYPQGQTSFERQLPCGRLLSGLRRVGLPAGPKKWGLMEDAGLTVCEYAVSLLCPLSMTRISSPIRWAVCQHYQCLDEASWRQYMSSYRPNAKDVMMGRAPPKGAACPICGKSVDIKGYFVDSVMLEVLKRVPDSVNLVTISVSLSGQTLSWCPADWSGPRPRFLSAIIDLTKDDAKDQDMYGHVKPEPEQVYYGDLL